MDARATLQTLRARMVAADLRSRSIRLTRCTKSGAFDLAGLAAVQPDAVATLLKTFGREPAQATDLLNPKSTSTQERELAQHLLTIHRAAHATWQETGADEMALGWPMCEARSVDNTWIRAPLLLAPVKIERHRTRATLTAQVCGPVELNGPFVRVLAREFGVRIELKTLLDGDEDRMLCADAATFSDLVRSLTGLGLSLPFPDLHPPHDGALWRLHPIEARRREDRERMASGTSSLVHAAVIGRFPRGGSQLVADYDVMLDATAAGLGSCQPLLSTFAAEEEHRLQAPNPKSSHPEDSDDSRDDATNETSNRGASSSTDPLGMRQWQVLPSDASQDAVFRAVFEDTSTSPRGVVVQGPPGTGKSQMLANVLAGAIAAGKKTLVVCQKRAALDVVEQRLESVGLQESCVVVHDTSRDRGPVAARLATRLAPLLQADGLEEQADAKRIARHAQAAERYRAHLAASQTAFEQLTIAPTGRPPLLALLEDDPPAPNAGEESALVDLFPAIAGVTEEAIDLACLQAIPLAPRCLPLAVPHPLAIRRSFADLDSTALETHFSAVAQALVKIRSVVTEETHAREVGAVTFSTLMSVADALARAEEPLALLSPKGPPTDAHRFRLFCAWTGGDKATGEWHRVQGLLHDALDRFVDVPPELVAAPQAELDEWTAALIDGEALETKWYRFASPTHWRSQKAIQSIANRTHQDERSRGETLGLLRAADQWRALIAALPDDNCFLEVGISGSREDLKDAIDAFAKDHARLEALHTLASVLKNALVDQSTTGCAAVFVEKTPACDAADDPWTVEVLALRKRLDVFVDAKRAAAALEHRFEPQAFAPLTAALTRGDGVPLQEAFAAFCAAQEDADQAKRLDREMQEAPAVLTYFLRRYRGTDAATALRAASRVAFLNAALDGRDPDLLAAPVVDEAALRATANAANDCRNHAGPAAAASLRQRVRALAGSSDGARLRKLLAQCEKKRRRASLRTLTLDGDASGLFTLVPVWLCSPDSVASLFDAQAGVFDLVIFDEASQCPVEAGLPALWRGRVALVAGDDQQMPPSHFFASREDEGDDAADEDADEDVVQSPSVLALARRAFPTRALSYHYRSADDSLIAFSNAAFYRGELTIAPRSDDIEGPLEVAKGERLGFRWKPVGGFWHRQVNPTEADAIVDEVERTLTLTPHLSVGVVCMNRPQADLVEERLEARAVASPPFAALLQRDAEKPPMEQLFVRNLENVQGDERDVVLFSIGYGRENAGGPVRARLGPLAQAGGEKRLNVAITRAKRQIVVVVSFAPEEMDVSRSKHAGPKLFQLWLQYARACARRESTGGLLTTAGNLLDGTAHHQLRRALDSPLGSRLAQTMRQALVGPGSPWRANVGLGREKIDFVNEALALDVTMVWQKPDAISRDVTSRAFWLRAGFDLQRMTASSWRLRAADFVSRPTKGEDAPPASS